MNRANAIHQTNEIKIKPHVQAFEVREKIEKALNRVASFEAQGLSISTDGGKVTLGGKLDNWYEHDLAENCGMVGARRDPCPGQDLAHLVNATTGTVG